MADDNEFKIVLKDFYLGDAPLPNNKEIGQSGHSTNGSDVDLITVPGHIRQSLGVSSLANGTQAGALGSELMRFILDKPVTTNATYGIADTKLHKISSGALSNSGIWPHAVTGSTDGSSVIEFQGALYYFFNKASGADIGKYDLTSTFDDDWGSTVPTGAAALQDAPHPVAKKQDIMLFGNGRYVGTYISSTNTLDVDKLDFGANTEVVDVLFHANQWWIAVNSGVPNVAGGTDRASSQIYLYDGAAITSLLSDEIALGLQSIGFMRVKDGVVYVCYKDYAYDAVTNVIGYVSGRQIKPAKFYNSSVLPTYAQNTIYQNMIIFPENAGLIRSFGAAVPQLPLQTSRFWKATYTTTVGALAAPFGVPMVSSTNSTNYNIGSLSSPTTGSLWYSLVFPLVNGRKIGMIDTVVVLTNDLGSDARCDLTLFADDWQNSSTTKTIATENRTRHVFTNLGLPAVSDFVVELDYANGSTNFHCRIRRIEIIGHWVEKA